MTAKAIRSTRLSIASDSDAVRAAAQNSDLPLHMSTSMRLEAERLARIEGISLQEFISFAVAEKLERIETEEAFMKETRAAVVRENQMLQQRRTVSIGSRHLN